MNLWNNTHNISTQICLALLANIKDFVIQKITAAKIVRINMYLIS